jgi:hypothetical protein
VNLAGAALGVGGWGLRVWGLRGQIVIQRIEFFGRLKAVPLQNGDFIRDSLKGNSDSAIGTFVRS